MKQVTAKAGKRTKILHIFSDSIPQSIRFTATSLSGGQPPGGSIEITRRPWFVRTVETFPLRAEQVFRKGFADADYAIHVTPDEDVRIAFQTRHFEKKTLFIVLAALVVLGALSAVLVPLIAGGAVP